MGGVWQQLELIWPVEERPEGFCRDKEWVESQELGDMLRFMDRYEKRQKDQAGGSSSSYKVDKKPKVRKFGAGADDHFEVLHEARFQRMPLSSGASFWSRTPASRQEIYKNIDLKLFNKYVFTSNSVSTCGIIKGVGVWVHFELIN